MKSGAERIERVALQRLVPYARNARTHSDGQVAEIAASISAFGFNSPVLIGSDDGIIAGHGRVLAAASLGLADVPCIRLGHLTAAERRAYILADNQIALNAGWDDALLGAELRDLAALGVDGSLLGFDSKRLDELLATPDGGGGATDPDEAPALEQEPITRIGDVWLLGPHRVVCGDATKAETLAALMLGRKAHCVWTDPPYNVAYKTAAGAIKNDDMADAAFRQFLVSLFAQVGAAMADGASIYVAHADTEGFNFRAAFAAAGLKLSGCLVWRKDSLVLGRSDYQWAHEPILYGWKPGKSHRWFGGRKQTTVMQIGSDVGFTLREDGRWQVAVGENVLIFEADAKVEEVVPSVLFHEKPRRSALHPTMKPVALIERMLKNSARPGEVVLDTCAGSGSTLMAAHRLGMVARCCELDPRYVDVLVRRWQEYSSDVAVNERTGEPFPSPVETEPAEA